MPLPAGDHRFGQPSAPFGRSLALARLDRDAPETERAFDRLARLASRLTGAPGALLSLIDADRQVFVGQAGLEGELAVTRQTPITHSYCQYVVAGDEPLVIPDAARIAALQRHPALTELGIRAYAGARVDFAGQPAGALCVFDPEPRTWTDDDLDAIRDLAAEAANALAYRAAVATEERYGSVIAAMSEGVVVREADGAVSSSNPAAERILGLTAAQIDGRVPLPQGWAVVDPDGEPIPLRTLPALETLRTGEPARKLQLGVRHPGGDVTWVSLSTEAIRRAPGAHPHAVVSTFRDVTPERASRLQLAAHVRAQEAVSSLATLVASEAPPGEVFAAAAQHARRVLDGRAASVVRVEADGRARIVGGHPVGEGFFESFGEYLGEDMKTAIGLSRARREPATMLHDDPVRDPLASPTSGGIAVPIEVHGRLWGAVGVLGAPALVTDPHARAQLARFADLVGLAVLGADARKHLARLATVDHLTGLENQRAFSERLEDEARRARRHERPLSLVLFDLDHFKLVNDTYGHEVGNLALAEFAQRLQSIRRGGEVVARIGGEEFAWILPDTDGAAARLAAERARGEISQTAFSRVGRLTVSAGVCALDDVADANDLFRCADLALYWAKANGRDTSFRYSAEAAELLPPDAHARRLERAKSLVALRALAIGVDDKDPATRRHSDRVASLAAALARVRGWHGDRVGLLQEAAQLHDVGKLGIPDEILHKPGVLTPEEHARVRPHPTLGAEMVADLLTEEQAAWVRHHHEAWDGSGYPDGLAGERIPEGARLLALAEAWDVMTVARACGPPRTRDEALAEVRATAGAQFCPDAVEALLELARTGRLEGVRAT